MNTSDNLWQGEKVRLRAFEPSDWEFFQACDRDTQTARDCYLIPVPRSDQAARDWAAREAAAQPVGDSFRWVIADLQGAPVGTLNTHTCDPRCGTFMYGLAIGVDYRRRGYASEAIRIVLGFYFNELRYQKATVSIYSWNTGSIRLHEKLGFQLEGRLRRMIYTKGEYFDELYYGITREEFCTLA